MGEAELLELNELEQHTLAANQEVSLRLQKFDKFDEKMRLFFDTNSAQDFISSK